jgi:hypothetical protein
MRSPTLLGEEDTVCAFILLGDEDVPGGVSSSYCASAVLSMRVTLLLLGDRSASGLEMRKSSPKSLGRRKDPSLVLENEVDFEVDEALGNNDA